MKMWNLEKEEPNNFELTILKQLDILDKHDAREKWLTDTKPDHYDLSVHKENMRKLKEICV